MRRYRATLAYNGTAYQGFQRQAGDTPTIQRCVEVAIATVTGQQVTVIGAGRTDTGVHASGQVIAFDAAWNHGDDDLMRAINANLPDDIALQAICQQPGFHPRFDAVSRVYSYSVIQSPQRQPLWRHRAWHVRHELDGEQMQAAADLLIGTHDFATFGKPPQGTNTVRTIRVSRWSQKSHPYGVFWVYQVEAEAFLQHMVRRIVGMLVDIGRGALTVSQFEAAFRAARLAQAVTVAPPQGLVLELVRYAADA